MSEDEEFEWGESKRLQNITDHGIDFVDAIEVFSTSPMILRSRYFAEERYIAIGPVRGLLWAVIFTMRGPVRRIISARRARRNERREYDAHLLGGGAESTRQD